MAQIRKPLVPAKVFRHFALATVGLTAVVAMLADGSHHEAQALADREELPEADTAKPQPKLVRRDNGGGARDNNSSDFFADSSGTFGAPMMRPARSGGTVANAKGAGGGSRSSLAGYTQAYLDSLNDEEYEALVEGLQETGMLDPAQRELQVTALERQSAARSGNASTD
ncbi:hypothetical protein [Aurantiacibacter suaedae]|uniref:hypothetical protein n=1 Tax=Aurantiacibacter suaedae TaxID=2545755 RepID=UPI0010F8B772|nr:hypothetical protein [Aurantiacibacter suaedae]